MVGLISEWGEEGTEVKYPKQVKEQALARMMAPRNEPVAKLSRQLNVTEGTLYAWRREALEAGGRTR